MNSHCLCWFIIDEPHSGVLGGLSVALLHSGEGGTDKSSMQSTFTWTTTSGRQGAHLCFIFLLFCMLLDYSL